MKIRFINPIKECVEIQGKGYTASVIAAIAFAIVMSIVCVVLQLHVFAAIYAVLGVGTLGFYGYHFGIQYNPEEEIE